MEESESPDWWLNSGARFVREGGIGRTVRGPLAPSDPWRRDYARSSGRDTDGGRLPQNLFRLVTRRRWLDTVTSIDVRLREIHLTDTPERGGWSGVLLFSRYVDDDNLYYAGLRHDGTAVAKRKREGEYVTLARRRVIAGRYDRIAHPNLLPVGRWFGLRLLTRTNGEGAVELRFDARDLTPGAEWTTVLETLDDGSKGSRPIDREGASGVRSDYMDVELDDFAVVPAP